MGAIILVPPPPQTSWEPRGPSISVRTQTAPPQYYGCRGHCQIGGVGRPSWGRAPKRGGLIRSRTISEEDEAGEEESGVESERPSEGPKSCRGQDRGALSREGGSCPRLEQKLNRVWLTAWVGAGPSARGLGSPGKEQRSGGVPTTQVGQWPLWCELFNDGYHKMGTVIIPKGKWNLRMATLPQISGSSQALNSSTFNCSEQPVIPQPFVSCLLRGGCKDLAVSSGELSLKGIPRSPASGFDGASVLFLE